jgi:uncharacterized repeat protein (TIGR01451 family)
MTFRLSSARALAVALLAFASGACFAQAVTYTVGNLVWNDINNNGIVDGGETGIDGVTVELITGDGSTLVTTTTTSGGGAYTFTSVPPGSYRVRLPATNFNPGGILRDYRSSTGTLPALAFEPAPSPDDDATDADDNGTESNGLLGLGGFIETGPFTLPSGVPPGNVLRNDIDFGVNNLPQIDLTATITDGQAGYLPGATLSYTVIVTNLGPADANGITVTSVRPAGIVSWTWTCAGGPPPGYNCSGDAGNPATFTDALDLPQLASITYQVTAQVAPHATKPITVMVVADTPTGMSDLTPHDNIAADTDTTPRVAQPVPAIGPWTLAAMSLLLVGLGSATIRRRRTGPGARPRA